MLSQSCSLEGESYGLHGADHITQTVCSPGVTTQFAFCIEKGSLSKIKPLSIPIGSRVGCKC